MRPTAAITTEATVTARGYYYHRDSDKYSTGSQCFRASQSDTPLSALSSSALSCRITWTILVLAALLVTNQVQALSAASVITGASGYVGRAVAHALIQEAAETNRAKSDNDTHHIVCLVRPSRVTEEQAYWNDYCSSSDQPTASSKSLIRVLPYDMLDGGASLRAAMESCGTDTGTICVHHIASWFSPTEDHVQAAQGNVKGTEDLVQTLAEFVVADSSKSKKISLVVTSSMAAVRATGQEPSNGQFYTSEDWNTLSQLGTNWGASYQWSKTESERRAWDLCQQHDDISMVALCPSFVFGPGSTTCSTSSFSTQLVQQWIQGTSQVQSRLFVDVRDVARAHVAADKLKDSANINGRRYIVSTERRLSSETVAQILTDKSESLQYMPPQPVSYDADFDGGAIPIGDKEVDAEDRLQKELGVTLRSAEETIHDMSQQLIMDMMLQLEESEEAI